MQIYKMNEAGEETYYFTDDFIRLVHLRLALEIAQPLGITPKENEIGTKKFWTSAKFVESTRQALGDPISDITWRRCFGKVKWDEQPNYETLSRFCKYMGIGKVPDVKRLSATELEKRIIEYVKGASFSGNEPIHSIIDYDTKDIKSDEGAIIRNDKDEIVYVVSSYLKKDFVVEVSLDTHSQERYAFKKLSDDKNRFRVASCPRDSKLQSGDRLTIESFGQGVRINGWNFHRFVDSVTDEDTHGVYISKGTIIRILGHY